MRAYSRKLEAASTASDRFKIQCKTGTSRQDVLILVERRADITVAINARPAMNSA
jgi:hypothetical protein